MPWKDSIAVENCLNNHCKIKPNYSSSAAFLYYTGYFTRKLWSFLKQSKVLRITHTNKPYQKKLNLIKFLLFPRKYGDSGELDGNQTKSSFCDSILDGLLESVTKIHLWIQTQTQPYFFPWASQALLINHPEAAIMGYVFSEDPLFIMNFP